MIDDDRLGPGREMTIFIEDVVTRKQLFLCKSFDPAATQNCKRVPERSSFGQNRQPGENQHGIWNIARKSLGDRCAGFRNPMPLNEVTRRVAKNRQLWEENEFRATLARGTDGLTVEALVPRKVANTGIDLGKCDLQRTILGAADAGLAGYPPESRMPRSAARPPKFAP